MVKTWKKESGFAIWSFNEGVIGLNDSFSPRKKNNNDINKIAST